MAVEENKYGRDTYRRLENLMKPLASEDGGALPIPPNFQGELVAELNNFFFNPFEPCDG